MAEAPKPQRRRRRQNVAGISSAVPTADTTPSGSGGTNQTTRSRRRKRRVRVQRLPTIVEGEVVTSRLRPRRRRLTRAIKSELKREGLVGPKVAVQQKITSTLGLVGPNTTGNVELELNTFLHPSLAKEANEGTAFGPLQALAAQYALWRIKYLTVKFTPMVGSSAVSGTVARVSLNLSQSPGSSSWSGLGARLHVDMHPGMTSAFHLRADQLAGPRDGGWWFTDTNEEGSQSAGPIIEVHTMGKTESTFQVKDWTGPLFLVEAIGMWQFANYNVKPALGSLERREGESDVEVRAQAAQPITLVMNSADEVAQFMDAAEPESVAVPPGQNVGETIFQIVDVGAKLAQNVAPPPFGWLIKGGWWFVKKLLGRTRAGTSEYVVYASLQDAQNNKPAVASETVTQKQHTNLVVTQINTPNVGPRPYAVGTPRAGHQTLQPGETFRLSSEMITELFIRVPKKDQEFNNAVAVPVTAIPGVLRMSGTGTLVQYPGDGTLKSAGFIQTPWWIGVPTKAPGELVGDSTPDNEYLPNDEKGGYIHTLYRLHNPRFTDQSGTFEFVDPQPSEESIEFCVLNNFGGGTMAGNPPQYSPGDGLGTVSKTKPYVPYGKVVATSRIWSGTEPQLDMIFSLIKITKNLTLEYDNVRDMILAFADGAGKISFAYAPKDKSSQSTLTWRILERDIPADTYLLGVSYTNTVGEARGVDIPITLRLQSYSRVESTFSPIFPYNLSGQMLPATSIDVKLRYVEYHPPSQQLIDQLRSLKVPFSLPSLRSKESGYAGPFVCGEDGGGMEVPCVLPPPEEECEGTPSEASDDDSDADSVEQFILELGNEMIELPRRWLNDPEFSRFLDM